jgi:FKBP-type peptidyl-prolyl cis-trans isomerase
MIDSVVVRFTGSLLDGTVIDSSEQRGGPVTMQMKEVLPGWAAALQMMRPGDQWQLFIPPSLAYADYGPPEIGMYTTLIYQLELVSFSASETNPEPSSGSQ